MSTMTTDGARTGWWGDAPDRGGRPWPSWSTDEGAGSDPVGWMAPSGATVDRIDAALTDPPDHRVEVSRETRASEDPTPPTDAVRVEVPTPATPVVPELRSPVPEEPAIPAQRRRIQLPPIARPARTRIITVANQKGGVGKTTTTVNLAAAMAQAGLRILVIDIDPQGNASTALGLEHHQDVAGVYDVLVDGEPLGSVAQECPAVPGLWCVPATIDLAGAEIELVSLVAREMRLKKAISALLAEHTGDDRYDYIFIDCPPSLGLLTVNAFVAADEVFIPIQCEYYALEGLSLLLKNIELIRAHLNPELGVRSILLTMYDARTRLSAQVADEVRRHFPDQVLRTSVPRSVRISEAPSHGQTVMTYDPASSGALSYYDAAVELAAHDAG